MAEPLGGTGTGLGGGGISQKAVGPSGSAQGADLATSTAKTNPDAETTLGTSGDHTDSATGTLKCITKSGTALNTSSAKAIDFSGSNHNHIQARFNNQTHSTATFEVRRRSDLIREPLFTVQVTSSGYSANMSGKVLGNVGPGGAGTDNILYTNFNLPAGEYVVRMQEDNQEVVIRNSVRGRFAVKDRQDAAVDVGAAKVVPTTTTYSAHTITGDPPQRQFGNRKQRTWLRPGKGSVTFNFS